MCNDQLIIFKFILNNLFTEWTNFGKNFSSVSFFFRGYQVSPYIVASSLDWYIFIRHNVTLFSNARSPSNRSRRLFQRNVVSLDSTQPDALPLVSNDRNPGDPNDIRSLPHTPPASFIPFPSSSSNLLMGNANFSRSPLSSSPRKNQLSR